MRVESVSASVHDRAWQIFRRTADQDFSFTDCTSFALIEEHRLEMAFTLDRGFRKYGISIVPDRPKKNGSAPGEA